VIALNYVSKNNRVETLTVRASLYYTVTNAATRELVDDIRVKAPQQYYTQNRMITGEDYNLFPYTNFSSILKVKAVNRTSSGISRYLDVLDVTGKYSSTNMFGTDGWLYQQNSVPSSTFGFASTNDINNVIYNTVIPILNSTEVKHFYYANYTRYTPSVVTTWTQATANSGSSTGYLTNGTVIQTVGYVTNTNFKYINSGSLLKFTAGTGNYFNAQNVIVSGTPVYENDKKYIWVAVASVANSNTLQITQNIPSGAVLESIIPVFKNDFSNLAFVSTMVNLIKSYKNLIQLMKLLMNMIII
jgi:hypothetical protein